MGVENKVLELSPPSISNPNRQLGKATDALSARLLMWALPLRGSSSSTPSLIDLTDPAFGRLPFPVMSMPILMSGNASRSASQLQKKPKFIPKTQKQEQIERTLLLPDLPENPLDPAQSSKRRVARFREETSYDLDKVSVMCYSMVSTRAD